ncbi:N-acetyltransferase [uncultured Parasphingopyxis sp.]|uniref:GNAT family N-acetyltransferase n=1 Tax=uncultured Parasphingopyxis sp. TaxID=1547918 RepID=UPI0026229B79|nr:N-acetyltransferase [uncultured Parasphingopyxis sp.]
MTDRAAIVETAAADARDAALSTITLGFASDPFMRWLWPDGETYLKAMQSFIPAYGGKAFGEGTAIATTGCHAAALWLPPGVETDDEAMEEIILGTIDPGIGAAMGAVMEEAEHHHPDEPIWYLTMIAADPAHINRGLGGALMRHMLERIDAAGETAYLESSNPKNISLYQRHGFEIVAEISHGGSPVLTPMIRRGR